MNPMIAFCGVDCSVCPDYETGVCPSCRLTEWKEGDACMPVACCADKGIDCCAFCETFPCTDMTDFYEESEGHRAAYCRMRDMREAANDCQM